MEQFLEYLLDFGISVLVTVIGFWLALQGNLWQERRKEIADAKQCLNDLKEELLYIDAQLKGICDFENSCYIDPLKTPVWTGLTNTNKLQLLAKLKQSMESRGEDVSWYFLLFEIYDEILEFNKWCNLFTEKNYHAVLIHNSNEEIALRTSSILANLYALRDKLLLDSKDSTDSVVSVHEVVQHLEKI